MSNLRNTLAGIAGLFAATTAHAFDFLPYQTHPLPGRATAIAVGDVTGDGINDVVSVTGYEADAAGAYKLLISERQPDGTLAITMSADHGGRSYSTSVAVGDFDGDQIADIVIGHSNGVAIFNAAGGTLTSTSYFAGRESRWIETMDVNLDGHLDAVGLSWSQGATVFLGDGTGQIAAHYNLATNASGYNDIEVADLNNDGFLDLAVMSGQSYAVPNLTVHHHNGIDGFLPNPDTYFVAEQESSRGLGTGDINGDGLDDVVIARGRNSPTHLWVYEQDAASGALMGPTQLPSHDIPHTVEIADMTGDSKDDVVVLHSGWVTAGLYVQNAGALDPEILHRIPYTSHYPNQGLALADILGDACLDATIADQSDMIVVLEGYDCVTPDADIAAAISVSNDVVSVSLDHLGGNVDASNTTAAVILSGSKKLRVDVLTPQVCSIIRQARTEIEYVCDFGHLAVGERATARFDILSKHGGSATVDAWSDVPDPDLSNNTAATPF